jgi:glycosyltransferase involved in cell wall biosynthesis
MWKNKKVSLVFPTYNEKDSIYCAIEDFRASGYIDEIVVVNNNAAPGTDDEVKRTTATIVYENRQGFGYSIRKGLSEATGDIIITSEPDGTFLGKDVIKLLAYSDEFDLVLGTRTTKDLIWHGAYMNWPLRIGNYLVAKMLEFLFNTSYLSDVGCTMRLISREGLNKIKDKFTIVHSCFNPEMVLLAKLNGVKFVEIPVNYKSRVGKSMGTKNIFNAMLLGAEMILLILRYRITSLFK